MPTTDTDGAPLEPSPALPAREEIDAGAPPELLAAREREQLIDKLQSLRRALPVLAQEMATARRQAAHLKLDNRRLTEQVRELRAELQGRNPRAGRGSERDLTAHSGRRR